MFNMVCLSRIWTFCEYEAGGRRAWTGLFRICVRWHAGGMSDRYEYIMSARPRGRLRLIHPAAGFAALPDKVRHRGPWCDGQEGDVVRLKPEYRLALARDGYVLVEGVTWGWSPEVG